MALIYSTDFESEGALGEIFDNQVGTTAAFDATHVKTGSRALLIHQTGTANSSKRNLAAGTRSMTIRVWFWLLAHASGESPLVFHAANLALCGFALITAVNEASLGATKVSRRPQYRASRHWAARHLWEA
jgi:hypothetical protein